MNLLTLIVLLPLAGFLLNGLLGPRLGKGFVTVVGCGLPILAFLATLRAFGELDGSAAVALTATAYTWAVIGDFSFDVGFYFDRLSALMTLIVTGVGSLIHVYSTGYMKDDAGYARYFAYLNLFLFFMLLLVLGRSLLVCFVGWEGVGLASYLLIGFWFEDPAKAAAGKKAFITNRVGDAGFLLGMFLLYHALGTLDFDAVNEAFQGPIPPALSASLVGLLLFIGATGKSAQIPLHVWLPDAMAGPTPVSALIHAATMVTAGVYLIARLNGLYLEAPGASQVIAAVGVATAFFAATIAVVQTDIKKVLAYSTISQLGFMFVALGVGAYGVAVFHVYTHAFFKACLFLGAGSVIHALGGEQDIRRMGGLARRIPVTFVTFAVATAAIAGLPPLAGFFSKDEILWFAFASERGGSPLLWAVASVTALLTAFYMFRLLLLAFLTPSRMDEHTAHHVHESPFSMTSVLVVLAVLSAVGGFFHVYLFLEPIMPLPETGHALEHLELPLVAFAVATGLAGMAAAIYVYRGGLGRAERLAQRFAGTHRLLSAKYYVDELYEAVLGRPLHWVSERVFLRLGDRRLIDGSLHGLASLAQRAAGRLGSVETGQLQQYVWFALLGVVALLAWMWRNG
jgi:NADH-quinone oxidoreductase subunit L